MPKTPSTGKCVLALCLQLCIPPHPGRKQLVALLALALNSQLRSHEELGGTAASGDGGQERTQIAHQGDGRGGLKASDPAF